MKVIESKKFLMVIAQWIVEAGSDVVSKKVSCVLDSNGGYNLSGETCLCLTLNFGAVDGLIVGCSVVVSSSNFSDLGFLLTLIRSNRSSNYWGGLEIVSSCVGVLIVGT